MARDTDGKRIRFYQTGWFGFLIPILGVAAIVAVASQTMTMLYWPLVALVLIAITTMALRGYFGPWIQVRVKWLLGFVALACLLVGYFTYGSALNSAFATANNFVLGFAPKAKSVALWFADQYTGPQGQVWIAATCAIAMVLVLGLAIRSTLKKRAEARERSAAAQAAQAVESAVTTTIRARWIIVVWALSSALLYAAYVKGADHFWLSMTGVVAATAVLCTAAARWPRIVLGLLSLAGGTLLIFALIPELRSSSWGKEIDSAVRAGLVALTSPAKGSEVAATPTVPSAPTPPGENSDTAKAAAAEVGDAPKDAPPSAPAKVETVPTPAEATPAPKAEDKAEATVTPPAPTPVKEETPSSPQPTPLPSPKEKEVVADNPTPLVPQPPKGHPLYDQWKAQGDDALFASPSTAQSNVLRLQLQVVKNVQELGASRTPHLEKVREHLRAAKATLATAPSSNKADEIKSLKAIFDVLLSDLKELEQVDRVTK